MEEQLQTLAGFPTDTYFAALRKLTNATPATTTTTTGNGTDHEDQSA